jgi:excisionase family DNA binding protein
VSIQTPTTETTRSLAEAALLVGCSTRTLRRMHAEGRVGATRVGGTRGPLRFSEDDIATARAAREIRIEAATPA